MNIEIITKEVSLSRGQKSAVTSFVNKNCNYYFLNFIRMTNGNVKEAIQLYYFDRDIRMIILKQVSNFELQMKKKLLDSIYKIDNQYIWYKKNYYTKHFTYSIGKKSYFDKMKTDVCCRMNTMNYTDDHFLENEIMFYATSYGIFLRIYNNILNEYRYDFVNQIYFHNINKSFIKRSIF